MEHMRWKMLVGAGLSGVLALGAFAACGDDDDSKEGAQEVRVAMSDNLRFEPDEIRVKAGKPVMLVIDNSKNSALHDFTVDKMPVMDVDVGMGAEHGMGDKMTALHMAMDPGKKGEMRFTPTEAGRYEFYCAVTGHAEAGMKGKLVVE